MDTMPDYVSSTSAVDTLSQQALWAEMLRSDLEPHTNLLVELLIKGIQLLLHRHADCRMVVRYAIILPVHCCSSPPINVQKKANSLYLLLLQAMWGSSFESGGVDLFLANEKSPITRS